MAQLQQKEQPTTDGHPSTLEPTGWRQAIASLRFREYRLLWLTSLFSSAARWIQMVSLGWLAFDLTGSALLLGSVMFVYQAPNVVLSPLVGVLVDRVDRRRLFIGSQLLMAGVACLLALGVWAGAVQPWHLFLFALVSGVESTIIHVLRQTLIPASVPRSALMNAIALNSAALTGTRIGAPFAGGLLIVAVGAFGNFLIQAVLLTAVAAAAFAMRVGSPVAAEGGHRSVLGDIGVALRYVWSAGTLRVLFAVEFLLMLIAMPFSSFLPVWAVQVLTLEADGLGLLYAAVGTGALVGTFLVASAGNVQRKGRVLLATSAGIGLALLGVGISPILGVTLVLLAALGATQSVFSTVIMTLVQGQIPSGLQGRVMSLYNVGHSMIAVGALGTGALASLFGIQPVVIGLGLMLLGLTAVYGMLPSIRRL